MSLFLIEHLFPKMSVHVTAHVFLPETLATSPAPCSYNLNNSNNLLLFLLF